MPTVATENESKTAVLDPPREIGGDFYNNPDHDASDALGALFGDSNGADPEGDEDPHTEHFQPRVAAKPEPVEPAEGEPAGTSALEARLLALEERNQVLTQALLAREVEEPVQAEEEEPTLAEPGEPDEETLRLFQMGDPDATKKFITWVKDVASYQAAKGLDASLPKRVERTLNTMTTNQGNLTKRVEGWWGKNGEKVSAIEGGKPFQQALVALEQSGKLSHKYVEAQLDRLLQHVEEQAILYGATARAAKPGPEPKPSPRGGVAKGFRPTSGGVSRRAPANAGESEREAANSVDALLGNRPLTSFHL